MQRRLGAEIPVGHPIMAWLVSHTCLLINALVRGEDGLTTWSRARGIASGQRPIGIGESVLYKLHLKGPHHDARWNMSARHAPGHVPWL